MVQGIEINFDNLQGLFRSQTLDGRATAATHERNDKMPGRNGEFDSSVADETATAGYQDGMSFGGHIGSILFRLRHSKRKAGHQRHRQRQDAIMQTLWRPLSAFSWC